MSETCGREGCGDALTSHEDGVDCMVDGCVCDGFVARPPIDVSVLPPFQPGMVLVMRGVDFGDNEDADRAILRHYAVVAQESGYDTDPRPALGLLPVIIHLADPESSIEALDPDEMAKHGWVRKP